MNPEAAPLRHSERWCAPLRDSRERVAAAAPLQMSGHVTRVTGMVMEAIGLRVAVGSACHVALPNGSSVLAEVVGFSGERLFLMPEHEVHGLVPGAAVTAMEAEPAPLRAGIRIPPLRRAVDRTKQVPVGDHLLGRVLDANGRPIDRLGPLISGSKVPLQSRPLNPLDRAPIREVLDVGVRAINALLTIGRGQRVGLFAGSGVGKSVLLGMMARYTSADVIVVGLIGERGREVKEFIEHTLGEEGLARSVVVAAPADQSPLLRLQGAAYATAIAEYFRNQGKSVLLIMDSLTRYAMAQREIALAIGEPPATKGYPPSVFAKLPQLVERAGNGSTNRVDGSGGGSITAFYTVLTEGDDQQDPIADSARAILDGHIVLSRRLADAGHYPAIDIEASISRAITSLIDDDQYAQVRRFKNLYARFQRSRDLISVGAYAPGSDAGLDEAVALYPGLESFLQQGIAEHEPYCASIARLQGLLAPKP